MKMMTTINHDSDDKDDNDHDDIHNEHDNDGCLEASTWNACGIEPLSSTAHKNL